MLILAVDTSSPATSLAIVCDQEVLAVHHEEHEHPPSDAVFGLLDQLLKSKGFALGDIDLFAACHGPGSFTGLRIGVGLVKALAVSLRKPVVGIDAITVLANHALAMKPDQDREFAVIMQGFKDCTFFGRFFKTQGRPVLVDNLGSAQGEEELLRWHQSKEDTFVDPNLKWALPGATIIDYTEPPAVTVARHAFRLAEVDLIPGFDEVQPLYLRQFNVGRSAKRPEDLR